MRVLFDYWAPSLTCQLQHLSENKPYGEDPMRRPCSRQFSKEENALGCRVFDRYILEPGARRRTERAGIPIRTSICCRCGGARLVGINSLHAHKALGIVFVRSGTLQMADQLFHDSPIPSSCPLLSWISSHLAPGARCSSSSLAESSLSCLVSSDL